MMRIWTKLKELIGQRNDDKQLAEEIILALRKADQFKELPPSSSPMSGTFCKVCKSQTIRQKFGDLFEKRTCTFCGHVEWVKI